MNAAFLLNAICNKSLGSEIGSNLDILADYTFLLNLEFEGCNIYFRNLLLSQTATLHIISVETALEECSSALFTTLQSRFASYH